MPTGPRPAPPDDTVRMIISGTTLSHRWNVIQWLKLTASSRAQADLNSVLASVMTALTTEWQGTWLSSTSVTGIEGIWKTPGGGEIIGTAGAGFVGTNGSSSAVDYAGAAFVLSWHINAYYRGGHPRNYFPGVKDSDVTNGGVINATPLSNVAAAALTYLNAVNALTHGGITGTLLGTVSFQSGGAWRSPPIFRNFTGVSCSPVMGTQRRRLHS